jgi:hypothetical protein
LNAQLDVPEDSLKKLGIAAKIPATAAMVINNTVFAVLLLSHPRRVIIMYSSFN